MDPLDCRRAASLSPPILFGPSTDWNLSSANSDQFTVECWVRFSAIGGTTQVLFGASFTVIQWYLAMTPAGTHELRFGYSLAAGGTGSVTSTGAAFTTGIWYYVAADKDAAGKIRLYRGVAGGHADMIGSATPANSAFDPTGDELNIGQIGLFGTNDLTGNLDEIRITKGIARYASDAGFNVPTTAFPRPADD